MAGITSPLDINSNIAVATPLNPTKAGYVQLAGTLSTSGDPIQVPAEAVRVSAQGRLSVGSPVILFNEIFSGQAINTSIFAGVTTTFTIAAGTNAINLNASNVNTAAAVARMTTYQYFPFQADLSTFMVAELIYTSAPQQNCITELGLMLVTGTAAPTDGVFFRWDTDGSFKACLINNTVLTSAVGISAVPSANVSHKYKIICENDRILYYIDGALVAVINSANDMGMPISAGNLPFSIRTWNNGTPTLASVIKLSYVCVGCQDAIGLGKDARIIAAANGKIGNQVQSGQTGTGGLSVGQANVGSGGTTPVGTSATNTAASLGSGLGGILPCMPGFGAFNDYIITAYLNPASTAAIPGKTLYITGVRIQGAVTTALTGGPVLNLYSLIFGGTAITLVTAESATAGTKIPRRMTLGWENYPATSTVGVLGQGVFFPFASPIGINPGEVVGVIGRNYGVITTLGVITYSVAFDCFWE